MLRQIIRLIHNESGVSPVEYALIAAIVTIATTFAVSAAGYNLSDLLPL